MYLYVGSSQKVILAFLTKMREMSLTKKLPIAALKILNYFLLALLVEQCNILS